ncbi:hypothetical protein BH20ACT2_BH20ACT2_09770 [soil metagenome]
MSTRWCPSCRAEYVAGVGVCADCDIALVDDAPLPPADAAAGAEQLGYELAEWSTESRVLLERLLTGHGVVHAWEAATLVVRADDEARADALIDQVEASNEPALDPDLAQVVYEMEGLGEEQRAQVADTLTSSGIAHGWDDVDDLVVYEHDDERFEQILDGIEYPDALPVDGDGDVADPADAEGGMEAQDALGELFSAADRLMRDSRDHQGVLALVDAAASVEALSLPYGFAAAAWGGLVDQDVALRTAIEDDTTEDDAIREQARGLRGALRPYV